MTAWRGADLFAFTRRTRGYIGRHRPTTESVAARQHWDQAHAVARARVERFQAQPLPVDASGVELLQVLFERDEQGASV